MAPSDRPTVQLNRPLAGTARPSDGHVSQRSAHSGSVLPGRGHGLTQTTTFGRQRVCWPLISQILADSLTPQPDVWLMPGSAASVTLRVPGRLCLPGVPSLGLGLKHA